MPDYICMTCGVQYAPSEQPPSECPICLDERQYVGWQGQRWTTLEEMASAGHQNQYELLEEGLTAIWTTPKVAIGQRALLLQTPAGNLLWDCVSYFDEATRVEVQQRGGISAIGISHPHFYSSCVEWSEAFGGVPIYIHADDQQWTQRPGNYVFWTGDTVEPVSGVALVRLGGHFDGAAIAHWPAGAGCQGLVLSGDTMQVVMDRRYVSFMYSYPNLIPLSAEKVEEIAATMTKYPFARMYGAFGGLNVLHSPDAVQKSAERYAAWVRGQVGTQPKGAMRDGWSNPKGSPK